MRKSKIDFYVKMKIFNFILLIICVTAVTDVMCNGNFSFVDKNHECFFLRQSNRTKSTKVQTSIGILTIFFTENIDFFGEVKQRSKSNRQ